MRRIRKILLTILPPWWSTMIGPRWRHSTGQSSKKSLPALPSSHLLLTPVWSKNNFVTWSMVHGPWSCHQLVCIRLLRNIMTFTWFRQFDLPILVSCENQRGGERWRKMPWGGAPRKHLKYRIIWEPGWKSCAAYMDRLTIIQGVLKNVLSILPFCETGFDVMWPSIAI